MMYNFDQVISRRGTNSTKWDSAVSRGKPADALPLWIADLDFSAPDCVIEALSARVQHGVFGYSDLSPGYVESLRKWFSGRFGYTFDPSWLVLTPGVVYAICMAIQAYTNPGDGILIQEPVYHPFRQTVERNGRKLVVNELKLKDGVYSIDFADFEQQIIEYQVKLFLLCSPHNPVGRVWKADELREMVRICVKHNCLVLADEVHCDFVFPGHVHQMLPVLVPEAMDYIILTTAPSKTFNLAGFQISNIFIANEDLRRTFQRVLRQQGYSNANGLGLVACEAAYAEGADWQEALLAYLWENMQYIDRFLQTHLPQVRLIQPEGTYLAWLDARELGLSPVELDRKLIEDAGVWLSPGYSFGAAGTGFLRVNTGCPRSTLQDCLERMKGVFA